MFKIHRVSFFVLLTSCMVNIQAQTNPVKHFSLDKEPTQIPSDSLGTTYFYSLSFEVAVDTLTSATFNLRNLATDSLVNQQVFNLPNTDGIYQTGMFPNGLIKDKNNFYIRLGNFKSKEPLQLVTDFIDSKNTIYKDILTTE